MKLEWFLWLYLVEAYVATFSTHIKLNYHIFQLILFCLFLFLDLDIKHLHRKFIHQVACVLRLTCLHLWVDLLLSCLSLISITTYYVASKVNPILSTFTPLITVYHGTNINIWKFFLAFSISICIVISTFDPVWCLPAIQGFYSTNLHPSVNFKTQHHWSSASNVWKNST